MYCEDALVGADFHVVDVTVCIAGAVLVPNDYLADFTILDRSGNGTVG